MLDEDVGYYDDERMQLMVGESRAGVEFKHLQKSTIERGGSRPENLRIEIEERTSLSRPWVKSGIYRNDNTERYVCGNDDDVWAFGIADLRRWHQQQSPKITIEPTIKSFVLYKTDAAKIFLYRFRRISGQWRAIYP